MADEGRTDDSTSGPAPRVTDPAADAARTFGDLLTKHGIKTTPPGPSKATTRATTLATVSSPPLSALVERMLTNSDNDLAEALARQTALATGKPADFAGGGAADHRPPEAASDCPLTGAAFTDGSGLEPAPTGSPPTCSRPAGQGRRPGPPGTAPRPHRPPRRRLHRHPEHPLRRTARQASYGPRPAP